MFSISLFYYISFFVLSPIRFCYMFYNFEVIILFLNASHLCNDLLPPPSGVPAPASHAHPTSAFFSFPYFWGASLDFGAATHLGATCFPPLSGVPLPVSHRHLTPQTSLPPRLPGYQNQPRMHISPRKHLLPLPSGVLPYAIRILGIFPCGTISAEQRMHRIS